MAGSFDPLPQGMEDFLARHQAPDHEKAALREHLMKVAQAQSSVPQTPSKLHGLLNNLFDHLKTPDGREEYLKLTKEDAASSTAADKLASTKLQRQHKRGMEYASDPDVRLSRQDLMRWLRNIPAALVGGAAAGGFPMGLISGPIAAIGASGATKEYNDEQAAKLAARKNQPFTDMQPGTSGEPAVVSRPLNP